MPDGTELIARYDIAGKYIATDMLRGDRVSRYWINQRFYWETIWTKHLFHVREWEERIVDIKTGEVLAQYVDLGTNIPPIGIGGNSLSDYKFWMQKKSCGGGNESKKSFRELKSLIRFNMENEL
ncbi:MAG: hypothetical protein KZQ78_04300 [Candidatus Thiodiazotropha sp. (ex Ustalcina ferruginea)]|nr:hypothetical protein [Candidatus Thiodiazotropha sp. (ex Ustalcina ferruginea)]